MRRLHQLNSRIKPVVSLLSVLISVSPVSYTHLDVYKRQEVSQHYGVPVQRRLTLIKTDNSETTGLILEFS